MTEIPKRCSLCGGSSFEAVATKLRYEKNQSGYQCKDCSLIFLYPPMSPEEERRFYEKEYGIIYSEEKNTTPKDLFEARQEDAHMYLDWVEDWLKPDNACLEIGCASGYFLALLRDRVKNIIGLETHLELHRYCQEIGIPMAESIEDIEANSMDRVFAFFVLEHLGDPRSFFSSVRRVCRPGANIFLVVPNVHDVLLSEYKISDFRDFYFTPAHQFYYSRETMGRLFRECGFSRYEILPKQRYDLSNHMHWMMTGRPGGMGRFSHIFNDSLLKSYAANLEDRFLCDTLFAMITVE
jgi:SAM-dependent methyltransferase